MIAKAFIYLLSFQSRITDLSYIGSGRYMYRLRGSNKWVLRNGSDREVFRSKDDLLFKVNILMKGQGNLCGLRN